MSKTILVTGAAGFIGSHVAGALLARGDRVIAVDNLNDYYDPARKRANVAELRAGKGADGLEFHEGDVRDRRLVEDLFARYEPRAVVHLAAMAGVRVSVEDPGLYYDVNLLGTLNLLDAAAGRIPGTDSASPRVESFAFASTSSVYGATEVIPFVETDRCDRPLAPYPASKRAAEMLGFSYHHLFGLSFTALRFFTVYGPRGRPDMMAYKVLDNIFFDREVPLYNGGKMHRDWTFVEDIAAGVIAAADRPLGYEVINLGRGEPVLLSDFVAMIEGLAGRSARLVTTPMLDADIGYTYADISKARELLGYDPKVSVAEGVERFWRWYQGAVLDR